jgi:hypothetical protein
MIYLLERAGMLGVAFFFATMSGLAGYRMRKEGFWHGSTVHLIFVFLGCLVAFGSALWTMAGQSGGWAGLAMGMSLVAIPTALTIRPITQRPIEGDFALQARVRELEQQKRDLLHQKITLMQQVDVLTEENDRLRMERDEQKMFRLDQGVRQSIPPFLGVAHVRYAE